MNASPLFENLDRALRFAYTIDAYPNYPKSELAKFMRGGGGRVAGMTKLDWHAQAAMIRAHVEHHMQRVEQAYIECWYGQRDEYMRGVHHIVRHVMPLAKPGAIRRRTVLALVRRYFMGGHKRRETLSKIAQRDGVELQRLGALAKRVLGILNNLSARAEGSLHSAFHAAGLIEY